MALAVGTRLGAYEIIGELGTGGMGEVYRATDTNLKREVAIKILPPAFATDADRIARFQREAEALAALNHSNIAQIYGLERSGESTALAMELVDGPTLADRIAEGPIPVDEALAIARQLADALEAAHGHQIVHRDLKPANIKLKLDGTVKVLDFGIATAPESSAATSGGRSPTLLTPALTEAGVLLGTAAYVSPEQARGRPVDQRADIWAFGCVLYEMLTGQLAFGGADVTTTLARVLEREVNTHTLPATAPPAVRHAIELCLAKDPGERIADIRDVKLALRGKLETGTLSAADRKTVRQPFRQRALAVATSVAGTAAVAALIAWAVWPAVPPRLVNSFEYDIPNDQTLRFKGRPVMALSPDGRRFVYNTDGGLYLRPMGELEARPIPGTEEDLTSPFFSRDGQSVAYWAGAGGAGSGQLKRILIDGGAAIVIADGLRNPSGASWGSDRTILYGQPQGIYRVPEDGGKPELVIPAREGETLYGPELLPDGDSVLFSTRTTGQWDEAQIVAQSLSSHQRTVLVEGGSDAHYVAGRLVYARGDGLFAVALDSKRLTVSGGAVPLVQGVMRAPGNFMPTTNYAVSNDGTLVYVAGSDAEGAFALVWVDRKGDVIGSALSEPISNAHDPRLSPDGGRVVLAAGTPGNNDLWVYDLGGRPPIPLTKRANDEYAVWNPDGTRIAFISRPNGTAATATNVYIVPADGSVLDPMPLRAGEFAAGPTAWSADGELILVRYANGDSGIVRDIVAAAADGTGEVRDVEVTPSDEYDAALSPNGRWLAYASDRTGRAEIWVKDYPDGVPVRVSRNGGFEPVWSRDGQELYYIQESTMMSVPVRAEEQFSFDPAEPLFSGPYLISPGAATFTYDVAPDGRFLMLKAASSTDAAASYRVVVVQNWVEELKRKVPTK